MHKLLRVEDMHVHYGAVHAIKGINFEVPSSSVVALIGCNGAGKSTTLRAISGLKPASKGKIFFEDKEITKLKPNQIVSLGISHCPEGRGIFSNLTVEENLMLGAYLRKDRNQIAEDKEKALELFPRLKERLWQNAGTLSGGEQQMLTIARALLSKPKLLLLDEPSLGLAPQIIEKIFETIVKVSKLGMTILLVEQNALLALEVAQHALVLETGELTTRGQAKDLLKSQDVLRAYLGI